MKIYSYIFLCASMFATLVSGHRHHAMQGELQWVVTNDVLDAVCRYGCKVFRQRIQNPGSQLVYAVANSHKIMNNSMIKFIT